MRCVVVLLFILLAPFARAERSSLRVPGAPSPVVGINSFDSMGVASYGPGIPSPTIDCVADGAAGYACTGATATAGGTGTMSGTSPFWYTGDLVTKPSTVYNGSGWHGLGDVGAHTGSFSGCTTFYTSAVDATSYYLHGRASNWVLIRYAATLYFYVYRAGGSETADTIGGLVANAWNVACWSYDLPTRKIRLNMNGVAATDGTGSSDITDGGTALKLGGGAVNWRGGVERFSDFNGFAASAAQLATMTESQRSLIATKPATSEATHTRVDATLCGPYSDAECHWLAPNVPCIHAPTYAGSLGGPGIEVYGPGSNILLQTKEAASEAAIFANAAWTKDAETTCADASDSCPLGPTGARMSLCTVSADAKGVYQDATGGTSRSAWLAVATGDSACDVTLQDYADQHAATKSLTATPVHHWSATAGDHGFKLLRKTGGCGRFCVWGAQSTAALTAVPFRASQGTSYLAPSGTVATTPQQMGTPSVGPMWIGVRASRTDWAAGTTGIWAFNGSGANSISLTKLTSGLQLTHRDGDAASYTIIHSGGAPSAGEHTIIAGHWVPLNGAIFLDGVQVGSVTNNSGTGISAVDDKALRIGYRDPGEEFIGSISKVCQGKTVAAVKRCLR